eukprot:scpid70351/ scgid5313/ Beta-1,4-N-acetylgalactosaminyltransferase bre-4; Bacillus thuringiensis toxin-resistant protein 4; Beta-4-GalNAcT
MRGAMGHSSQKGLSQHHTAFLFRNVARRSFSYLRCSSTGRLLIASMFIFSSVYLFLAFKAPPPCEPCIAGAPLNNKAKPESPHLVTTGSTKEQQQWKHVFSTSFADTTFAPAVVAETTNIPAVSNTERKLKLIDKAAGDSLNVLEVTKTPSTKGGPSSPDATPLPPATTVLNAATATTSPPSGLWHVWSRLFSWLPSLPSIEVTKKKFRNPPVPERPVISDEEQAKHRLAIIIPYRDRLDNLKTFVPIVAKVLEQQKIKYSIYVVGQSDLGAFNRGKLCNIGFQIAEKDGHDYIVIHDVDKVPASANVSYRWPGDTFVHMATCVEQFKYELPYYNFLGGVVMFRMDHYSKFNGMTNLLWGFGAEDDELWVRIKRKRLRISRAHACEMGRFVSLNHGNSTLHYPKVNYIANYNLYRHLLKRRRQMEKDGLGQLEYKLLARVKEPLYGYVNVSVDVCHGDLGRASIEETGCDGPKPREVKK